MPDNTDLRFCTLLRKCGNNKPSCMAFIFVTVRHQGDGCSFYQS